MSHLMLERILIVLLMFSGGTLTGVNMVDPEPVVVQELDYPDTRAFFVNRLAEQFGKADTVLLGDSLIELADFRHACGRTFNGGIGGGRISDIVQHGPHILEHTKPETVVLAIGANHFILGDEIELFRDTYPALVDSLSNYRLVLVGVQNSAAADAFVRKEARRIGAPYVAPIDGPFLEDGLHHAEEGKRNYRRAVQSGCAALERPQA